MAATTNSTSPSLDITPIPSMASPAVTTTSSTTHPTSNLDSDGPSNTSSDNDEHDTQRISRSLHVSRPKFGSRKSSGTIIVPRDHPHVQAQHEEYPPEDARAMSPRRSSEETEKLGQETRIAVQEHARSLQSGLNALAERIESVKSDHDKLEKQNIALQDYIGGLTRSMSRTDITSTKAKK
ncbi:hypothetical protein MMC24_005396 [Lignoscripta atroalba]|nr:hypothetical protein [Lignoscripta atroalba]